MAVTSSLTGRLFEIWMNFVLMFALRAQVHPKPDNIILVNSDNRQEAASCMCLYVSVTTSVCGLHQLGTSVWFLFIL